MRLDEDTREGRGSKEINKAQGLLSKCVHDLMRNERKGEEKGQCYRYADNCVLIIKICSFQVRR